MEGKEVLFIVPVSACKARCDLDLIAIHRSNHHHLVTDLDDGRAGKLRIRVGGMYQMIWSWSGGESGREVGLLGLLSGRELLLWML
jgi:hypothetical protein